MPAELFFNKKLVEKMNGLIYKVSVYNGMTAYIHKSSRIITEVFIPEAKIIFNVVENDTLNVWQSDKPRCKKNTETKKIQINDNLVKKLQELINLKKDCLKEAKAYF